MKLQSYFDTAVAVVVVVARSSLAIAQTDVNQADQAVQQGDFERAIELYSELIKDQPNDAVAYNGRGVAYIRQGDRERALGDFDHAIKLNLNFTQAYVNRGRLLIQLHRDDQAIADATRALRLKPMSVSYTHLTLPTNREV